MDRCLLPHQQDRLLIRKIKKALTVTYLNYELFRRDVQTLLDFLNSSANFVTYMVLLIALQCYFVFTNMIKTNQILMWFEWLASLFVYNLFFYMFATVTNRVNDLSHKICNMTGRAGANSLELTYIISLWRRQMLSEAEVKSLFTTRTFGIQYTQSNQITFNSYVLGLALLMSRTAWLDTALAIMSISMIPRQ